MGCGDSKVGQVSKPVPPQLLKTSALAGMKRTDDWEAMVKEEEKKQAKEMKMLEKKMKKDKEAKKKDDHPPPAHPAPGYINADEPIFFPHVKHDGPAFIGEDKKPEDKEKGRKDSASSEDTPMKELARMIGKGKGKEKVDFQKRLEEIKEEGKKLQEDVLVFSGTAQDKKYVSLEQKLRGYILELNGLDFGNDNDEGEKSRMAVIRQLQGVLDQLRMQGDWNQLLT